MVRGKKIKITEIKTNLALVWTFPYRNSSLNWQMATKWCTKHEVAGKRCPVVFQGYLSNLKVTRAEKSTICLRFEHFWMITPVLIHRWIWNESQSFKRHWRGTLLFFKVIHPISRSHRPNKFIRLVTAIKSLRFALFKYSPQMQNFCHIVSTNVSFTTEKMQGF